MSSKSSIFLKVFITDPSFITCAAAIRNDFLKFAGKWFVFWSCINCRSSGCLKTKYICTYIDIYSNYWKHYSQWWVNYILFYLREMVTKDWWCALGHFVFTFLTPTAQKWFWTANLNKGPFSSSIRILQLGKQL